MISAAILALALMLQLTPARPASAQTLAECQSWLCLPAGYDVRGGSPTAACEPARQAVLRRLRRHMDPLPEWSDCAARFGWDAANLAWTFPAQESCPHGGRVNAAGLCQGTAADGCTYTYSPRKHGTIRVLVDGAQAGAARPYTLARAETPATDPRSCPPAPPPPLNSGGGGDPNVGIHGDASGEAGGDGGAGVGGLGAGGLGGGVGGIN